MPDFAVVIVGGGVVGLAIAAEISKSHAPVVLVERNDRYGSETSSRNSEVIHAGLYYPEGSLKARLCVEGNRRLYELCSHHDIPHRRFTKILTATTPDELLAAEAIFERGKANGARLERLTAEHVHALEPHIVSVGGILSHSTGVISAHGLMDYFAHTAKSNGTILQLRCAVVSIEHGTDGYTLGLLEGNERSSITAERVINAAGLESDTIAELAGMNVEKEGYRLHWSKGCYFSAPGAYRGKVSRLIYPVPTRHSLGIHVVLDLAGRLRFGPDVEYLADRKPDYTVNPARRAAFAASVRRILPFVQDEDLTPDMAGIRPKLQRPDEEFRDFVIKEESDKGLPGFINLIGIESPGLTASPAIANMMSALLQ